MIHSFQQASFRDNETGLYNQAYFLEIINREWHRALRENSPLAIILFEPHLKQDHQGEFLELAELLDQQTYRSSDILSRFDQSHFAMGLFSLDEKGAKVVIKRIQKALSANLSQCGTHFNVSIGAVHVQPNRDYTINDVFNAGLQALEEAERCGGNATVLKPYQVH